MDNGFTDHLADQLHGLSDEGLLKPERVLASPQGATIILADGSVVLNLCANNYLGLANHPDLVGAASDALIAHGYGMASVRFICGTHSVHKELEARLTTLLGTEDTILYPSCFDANTGLFETILGDQDAIISDALNHASIIDGVRLCKATRYRYANNDMDDLARQLEQAGDHRFRLIATDGVFSMDGVIANLGAICDLAERHDALVMVDDSHAVGFVGPNGGGTPDHWGVQDRVDIVTGTLGKAMGGASGGYTSGRSELVEWLRQRSRPYLFSNSVAPAIAATGLTALDLIERGEDQRTKLANNAEYFRSGMTKAGFTLTGADHAIIPVMIGNAAVASEIADLLLDLGVYVIAFSFPVVPRGAARIRTQMSAAHDFSQLDQAISAFSEVGATLGVIT